MVKIVKNQEKITEILHLFNSGTVPQEYENSTHDFIWSGTKDELSNSYLAIVAICHQTSPIGERRLEGIVNGIHKMGWDYLKEKFLVEATRLPKWHNPEFWANLRSFELSNLFNDTTHGLTLNRVNERAFLLNDLGRVILDGGESSISKVFLKHNSTIAGEHGFLSFLSKTKAYKDPVKKKSMLFLSIMVKECGWELKDSHNLLSPVDYHEIRGHLRIGTISIIDDNLIQKIRNGICIDEQDDIPIRTVVQEVNNEISGKTGCTSGQIHYLFWNVFRNCCSRDQTKVHCITCGDDCTLSENYKSMGVYDGKCIFSSFCNSVGSMVKVTEPPYAGHYY